MNLVIFAASGLVTGFGLSCWVERMCRIERQVMNWPPVSRRFRWQRCLLLTAVTAILFVLFQEAVTSWGVLETPEVQPSGFGRLMRMIYHLTLISLLVAATATDFDCYVIPDQITIPGILFGVVAACAVGELQLCHWWVDWHTEIKHLRGPLIPGWYDSHRFWHALAWTCTGIVTGASITWLARVVSSWVLGQEAMGLGDVILMAMIGSFVGWQAVILVFLLAPLTGLTVGVLIKIVSGKNYLPYGPWLSLATGVVLFRWGWLWERTRLIFSDWLGLAILCAIGLGGFVILLALIRLYRAIPGRRVA